MAYDAEMTTGRLSPLDEDDPLIGVEEEDEAPAAPSRRRWMLVVVLLLLFVAVAGGGYWWWWQMPRPETSSAAHAGEVFVEAPAMVVNVRGADGRAHLLKLRFVLVAADEAAAEEAKLRMPMLIDGFQSFVRELRPEDLDGSAAVFRIKEEMMVRVHAVLGADSVKDILIQDLIEQ